MTKLWASFRRIPSDLKSKEPLLVGAALTKAFLAIIIILAILPQKTEGVWQFRIWAFLISPSNVIGDTLAGIAGVLAFLWIIITVWLQSEELKDQKKVLIGQKEEFEKTNENMLTQQFEVSFFSLVQALNSVVDSIDLVSVDNKVTRGRDCFYVYYERLHKKYQSQIKNGENIETSFENANRDFWNQYGHEFGHYFRFLYNCFRVISESPQAQPRHGKLLRSLLSDYELILLFYNSKTTKGKEFVQYIVKFNLLDNIRPELLLNEQHRKEVQELIAQSSQEKMAKQ